MKNERRSTMSDATDLTERLAEQKRRLDELRGYL